MNHKILVVLTCLFLLASCSDEDEMIDPEFPALSKTELNNFLTSETISLKFSKTDWEFSADDMQASASNCFINGCLVQDTIALGSGLVSPDGRYFFLNADVVPYNDDIDVLTKHFFIGDRTVGNGFGGYSISMRDPKRPNLLIELLRIKVVKVSQNTQLYWDFDREIKVWFLMDFNIRDANSQTVVEKIRNARYINEFFLIDFSREQLNSGRTRFDRIITAE